MSSAEGSASASASAPAAVAQITEDEASLYDRQIRLWGLEAQNRMRGSTVLVLGLRGVAHETIKNLVLAGIGRLIVMDDGEVTEEDLGSGFLFREEECAVGQERTTAASAQIASLNPLVSLTCLPTLAPFVRDKATAAARVDADTEMVDFLRREKVDVVVACDLGVQQVETIDLAARAAGAMFYASTTYGFFGYVFADLGEEYEYVYMPPSTSKDTSPTLTKKSLSFPSFTAALDRTNWHLPHGSKTSGRSPYRDLTRQGTKERVVYPTLEVLALWEYERQHGHLPKSDDKLQPDFGQIHHEIRTALGVNPKAFVVPREDRPGRRHLPGDIAQHADAFFPPTLAIVGGLLAQDVLRALSRKDQPITNLLVVDSLEGSAVAEQWNMTA